MSSTITNNNQNHTTEIGDHTAFRLPLPEWIEDVRSDKANVEYTALTQRENAIAYTDAETRDAERARRRPLFNNGAVRRTLFPVC